MHVGIETKGERHKRVTLFHSCWTCQLYLCLCARSYVPRTLSRVHRVKTYCMVDMIYKFSHNNQSSCRKSGIIRSCICSIAHCRWAQQTFFAIFMIGQSFIDVVLLQESDASTSLLSFSLFNTYDKSQKQFNMWAAKFDKLSQSPFTIFICLNSPIISIFYDRWYAQLTQNGITIVGDKYYRARFALHTRMSSKYYCIL